MSESRARFDEASAMIAKALETGWIEGDGPYYPQPRTQLRPSPPRSFTPDQIIEKIAGIKDVLGSFELTVLPSFGGMPYEQAEQSLELWCARQPWCNGSVGMYGPSYLGMVQFTAVTQAPPALKALLPIVTPADYHWGLAYRHGAFHLGQALRTSRASTATPGTARPPRRRPLRTS
jgi:hypothetical protein